MILVTGATGTVGRPLVGLLIDGGAQVRAVTRNPQVAHLPEDVEIVAADASRPETLAAALEGVYSLFVHPRAVGDGARDLLRLAREKGVERVAVLSAMNVDDDLSLQPSRYNGDNNKEVEEAVIHSGIDWVSLRSSSFAPNAIGLWGGQIRASDVVRGPYAAFAWAPIDPLDVAEVAAHGLFEDELRGRRIVLTGPQSLTQAQSVAIIGDANGRDLCYEEIPPQAARQAMIQQGLRPAFVDAYLGMLARSVGQVATTTDEVQKVLRRPARTFAQWANNHVEPFQASG